LTKALFFGYSLENVFQVNVYLAHDNRQGVVTFAKFEGEEKEVKPGEDREGERGRVPVVHHAEVMEPKRSQCRLTMSSSV
jgi:hypothetical protein